MGKAGHPPPWEVIRTLAETMHLGGSGSRVWPRNLAGGSAVRGPVGSSTKGQKGGDRSTQILESGVGCSRLLVHGVGQVAMLRELGRKGVSCGGPRAAGFFQGRNPPDSSHLDAHVCVCFRFFYS